MCDGLGKLGLGWDEFVVRVEKKGSQDGRSELIAIYEYYRYGTSPRSCRSHHMAHVLLNGNTILNCHVN